MGRLEVSEEIDRPPETVFRFVVTDHVENHPRWDPSMHLERITPGPIAVGTRLRRRRTTGETTIEGEMEFVEVDPDRGVTAVIRDATMELRSGFRLEGTGPGGTVLTIVIEADDSVPLDAMREPVRGSLRRMKALIEAET